MKTKAEIDKPAHRWSDGRFKWKRYEAEPDSGSYLSLESWTQNWRIRIQANDFEAEHFLVRLSTLKRTTPDKIREAVEHLIETLDELEWSDENQS